MRRAFRVQRSEFSVPCRLHETDAQRSTLNVQGSSQSGFTLLELLVVMTIIGILAAIAVPALKDSPQRAREAALREDLFAMRSVIDQYHGDKGNYPADLQTLVTEGYLRKIPLDPMTKAADSWVIAYEEAPTSADAPGDAAAGGTPGIIDVHSGSNAKALDGTLYKDW
jgi:general secretion pathway protein G